MEFNIYRTNEKELIEGCCQKDRSAQKRLYDRYAPHLYGICLRYLKDPADAEDALVISFTRILDRISQYQGEGSFEGWMRKIAIRESLQVLRKKNRLPFESPLDTIQENCLPSTTLEPLHLEDLLHLIQQLPPGYRAIFNLYAIDGFTHKEIAEQLHITENTSKSQLSRARSYLQKMVKRSDQTSIPKKHDAATR